MRVQSCLVHLGLVGAFVSNGTATAQTKADLERQYSQTCTPAAIAQMPAMAALCAQIRSQINAVNESNLPRTQRATPSPTPEIDPMEIYLRQQQAQERRMEELRAKERAKAVNGRNSYQPTTGSNAAGRQPSQPPAMGVQNARGGKPVNTNGADCVSLSVESNGYSGENAGYRLSAANTCGAAVRTYVIWVGDRNASEQIVTLQANQQRQNALSCMQKYGCTGNIRFRSEWVR